MAYRLLAPQLLSLVGQGFLQDPYAVDGWHLRWFVSPDLGLPREPFKLWRHPVRPPEEWANVFQQPLIQPLQGGLARWGHRNDAVFDLCRMYHASGTLPAFQGYTGAAQLTADPMVIDLRCRSGPDPAFTPSAGLVLVEVILEPGEGAHMVAETYTAHGYRVVDEARALHLTVIGPRPTLPGVTPPPPGPQMFRMIVSGEHIHRLRVQGKGWLELCAWIDTWDFVEYGGWDELETVPLAVQDPSETWYRDPYWPSAIDWAVDRLMRGCSQSEPPWIQPDIPPPPGFVPMEPWHLEERYLAPYEEQIRQRLEALLAESHGMDIPQKDLRAPVDAGPAMGPRGGSLTSGGQSHAEVPLLGSLLLESMDYHLARLLGLALCVPLAGDNVLSDVKVEVTLTVDDLQGNEGLLNLLERVGESELTLVSFVPALFCQQRPLPERPPDLRAEVVGRATGDGAKAHVQLGWRPPRPETPQAQARVPLLYALSREGPDGLVALNPFDEWRGRHKALLPARHEDGRAIHHDLALPMEGDYIYRVSAGDMWDRWSEWQTAPCSYYDDRVPLPPGNVQAAFLVPGDKDLERLLGESYDDIAVVREIADEAAAWAEPWGWGLRTCFEWTDDHAAQSPAVHAFSLRVRRGNVPLDPQGAWRDPALWPGVEAQQPPTPRDPVILDVGDLLDPMLDPANLIPETVRLVSAAPFARTLADGSRQEGIRYVVDIAGFDLPAPSVHLLRQWLSVGVVAHSYRYGNDYASPVSQPGVALLLYQAKPDPVVLPALDWSSYPDATGRSQFELSWTRQAGIRYAVYRTDENALLEATGATAPTGTAQAQAAALRAEAAKPAARHAFERLNDAPAPEAGSTLTEPTYVDSLPGYARVRYIYCLVGVSPTGVEGDWPSSDDAFVVVHVPAYVVPGIPRWDSIRQTDDGIQIAFNVEAARYKDQQGSLGQDMPDGIEIYRCIDEQRLSHVRHMRYVGGISKSAIKDTDTTAVYLDENARPWRQYHYRAVARGPVVDRPLAGGGTVKQPAARSPASEPMTVVTYDPHPPAQARTLVVSTTARGRALSWQARHVQDDTPLGPFTMAVWRRWADGNWQQVSSAPAAEFNQGSAYRYLDEEKAPQGVTGVSYRIRIVDPLQRHSDSDPVTA